MTGRGARPPPEATRPDVGGRRPTHRCLTARHDPVAFAGARSEDAVVADEMEVRRRDQGRELLEELQGLEDDVGRAVAPAILQPVEEPAIAEP